MFASPLLNDMIIVSLSNGLSDAIAQVTEYSSKKRLPYNGVSSIATITAALRDGEEKVGKEVKEAKDEEVEKTFRINFKRLRRFLLYGFADGLVIHNWLIILEYLIKTTTGYVFVANVGATVERVALDQLLFTPFWCVWFISCMTFISKCDGTSSKSLRSNVSGAYMELLLFTWTFFLPVSIFVYSSVPFESRVLAFSAANILYTILTSLWSQVRLGDAAPIAIKTKH